MKIFYSNGIHHFASLFPVGRVISPFFLSWPSLIPLVSSNILHRCGLFMSTAQGTAGLAKTLGPGLPSGLIRQVGPLTMAGQNSGSRYSIRIHSSRVSCDNRAGQNNDSESSIEIKGIVTRVWEWTKMILVERS
jgi:hypothetical protein